MGADFNNDNNLVDRSGDEKLKIALYEWAKFGVCEPGMGCFSAGTNSHGGSFSIRSRAIRGRFIAGS